MFYYGKDHLTVSRAIDLARGHEEGVIAEETRHTIQKAHQAILTMASKQDAVYGVNTGFGSLCNTKVAPEQTSELQRNLLLSHSVGVGNDIDEELVRLMIILKVHALCQGFSGVSLDIIERLLWHLEEDILPCVPEQGSLGASGDLAPLAHLSLPLIGEGQVLVKGEKRSAAELLEEYGLDPIALPPKSGLALINGTQFILAHAVWAVDEMHALLDHADLIGAMMLDGLKASRSPFDLRLHETRPHDGLQYVASRLWYFLEGSQILESHKDCDRVQDPYSLRCIPQVHGASRHAWRHLADTVELEMNAVTDNPVLVSETEAISGGNFHGQPLALPLDYASLAMAEIGNISERRIYFSLEGKVGSVPTLLLKDTGLHSGFMIVQYTAAALVSENKSLCFPPSADSIPSSLGQEDHVSMGSISGRRLLQICGNVEKVLACELMCAAQALDFHRPLRSSTLLDALHARVRMEIDFAEGDRIFGEDIQAAQELISSRELLQIERSTRTVELHESSDSFEDY